MSSYRQKDVWMTVETALREAVAELRRLNDDMADLCAGIEAQFPDTFERIPKYGQAFRAWESLQAAIEIVGEGQSFALPATVGSMNIPVMVGKQTRQGRETSQRVRLGNARIRLASALTVLESFDRMDMADVVYDLRAMLGRLGGISFPVMYG